MYKILFSPRAVKSLKKIPKHYQVKIKDKIEELSNNIHLPGTIKLVDSPVAQYRHRVGNYRILFDIDEIGKIIEILDILQKR